MGYIRFMMTKHKDEGFVIKKINSKDGKTYYYILKNGSVVTPFMFDSVFNANAYIENTFNVNKD